MVLACQVSQQSPKHSSGHCGGWVGNVVVSRGSARLTVSTNAHPLPVPELLMMVFCRKDWKRISVESSLMPLWQFIWSRNWTETNVNFLQLFENTIMMTYTHKKIKPDLLSTGPDSWHCGRSISQNSCKPCCDIRNHRRQFSWWLRLCSECENCLESEGHWPQGEDSLHQDLHSTGWSGSWGGLGLQMHQLLPPSGDQ